MQQVFSPLVLIQIYFFLQFVYLPVEIKDMYCSFMKIKPIFRVHFAVYIFILIKNVDGKFILRFNFILACLIRVPIW